MAQQYVTDAGVLIIPSAVASIKVQAGVGGLATSGVLMLVGEANAGPDYSLEGELGDNAFGPDQLAEVVAKYKSGPLVDAFRAASAPANDPDIQGSPSRMVLVKTNVSGKASGVLDAVGGGDYGTLYDKSYGELGNLIYFTVDEKRAEVKPTTSAFTYIPPVGAIDATLRANGDVAQAASITANMTPTAFVSLVEALTDISASGGVDRGTLVFDNGETLALAATGNVVVITRSKAWDVTPTVGDTLVIADTSVIEGGSNENIGAYVITAATSQTITATKLSDAGAPGAVAGTITPPANVSATSEAANLDLACYSPVAITLTSDDVVGGLGKSLEINDAGTGADELVRTAFLLGTATPVSWISLEGAPKLLTSAAEYAVTLNVLRQLDGVQEEISAGGQIALKLGYKGDSCAVTVGPSSLSTVVAGGDGNNLEIDLKKYSTLADLAAYINAQPGYVCAPGSNAISTFSSLALDEGDFTAGTDWGNYTLRLKVDAVKFFTAIRDNSVLVQLGNEAAPAASGLPDVMADVTYLSGGTKGATTDAVYNAAIDALEGVKGNFLIPLFSRDAADDIEDELTDSGSTYTIANVQAYAKTHCIKMSTLKRRRNRQAFLSNRGTFSAAQDAAQTLASFRCACAFQDVKNVSANGIVQFQPWMGAVLAAATQAAGFYRAIVHKGINCSGALQAAGDFKDSNDTNVEDALLAGLLIIKKSDEGGFFWVSDQTTYAKDDNFVYNSIQAVYVADVIGLTCAQRMEKAFVGQSVADVSAALALSALEAIMADFLRLKLIAPSDDAPKGFKNATVKISGTAMVVRLEIKLAGAIYFIPVDFLVSQVTQSAG